MSRPTHLQIEEAKSVVAWYTLAAVGTGAVPVPAASAAVIAENGAMLAHLRSVLDAPITWGSVLESMGFAATLNIFGKQVFVEGAKLLGWGTGSFWALAALSGLGATTAGVQTYILGRLAIEIAKNGGPLSQRVADSVVNESKSTYDEFVKEWRTRGVNKPNEAHPEQ